MDCWMLVCRLDLEKHSHRWRWAVILHHDELEFVRKESDNKCNQIIAARHVRTGAIDIHIRRRPRPRMCQRLYIEWNALYYIGLDWLVLNTKCLGFVYVTFIRKIHWNPLYVKIFCQFSYEIVRRMLTQTIHEIIDDFGETENCIVQFLKLSWEHKQANL